MRACPACGNQNPDEMAFCLQCGRSFQSAAVPDMSTDATVAMNSIPATQVVTPPETGSYKVPFSSATPPPSEPKKSRFGWIIGGIVGLFLLVGIAGIALIGGYFFLSRSQEPPARLIANTDPPPRNGTVNNKTTTPAATPETSFAVPTEPTKAGSFTVYANEGWQLSDLETVGNEEFTTRATGLIDLADLRSNVGPKGLTDVASKSRRLIADFATGALLMRTRYADGKFSNVQPVSAAPSTGSWQNFPDESGRLEFCVNDNAPEDNGGQFTVTLKLTRVPKPKKQ